MTRRKTISAVFAAVLVVLAGGAAVTLAATSTGGNATNAIQDETTTVAGDETTVAVDETTTAEPVETETEAGETGDEPVDTAGESFNVSDLGAPNTAVAGDTITVNATVTNDGTESATQNVEFRLDGDLVERQEVTLEGGESENVTFEVDTTGLEPGLHIHGVQTQDFGEVGQLTILEQGEDEVEETTTEEEVVEETTTEEEVVEETTTEEEVVEETTTEEEVVEETTTEEEVVEETTTEEEVVEETTTEEEVVEETTTEEEVVEETTTEEEDIVEETPTEIEVGEPPEVQAPDQLVFQVEQMQIDEWSFVIGDSETPDRTEVVENVEIRDRTQRINLTELMQEDGTIEDAMDDGQVQTPTEVETPGEVGTEDLETVRVVIRNVTIENVTFIVELPDEEEFEMPETPEIETPTEIEETPTEVEETPTEIEETPTEVEEETTTEEVVEETTTEEEVVEETTTEEEVVEETTTEEEVVEETTTEEEVVEETTTEEEVVEETTTEAEVGETTTEAEVAAQSFEIESLDAPESAAIGDSVTVSAEITNPGDQESTQEVEFRLDGDLVERQEVTLAEGETENVTFEVDTTGLEAGTYVHGVLTDEFGELALITLEEGVEETPTEVEETTTEAEVNETETEVGETTTEAAAGAEAEVSFADQESDGATVVVDSVTLSEGGFVTIHDETLLEGDAFGSVVGTSEYLEAGTHENVTVELDEPLTEGQTLIAMPHQDTNANQQYDFVDTEGVEDGPYVTAEGDAVVDPGNVTVGTAEGTTTEA